MDTNRQPGLQIAQVILLSAKFAHREDAFAVSPHTTIADIPMQIEAKVLGEHGKDAAAVRLRAWTPPERTDLLYSIDVEIAAIVASVPGEENLDPFDYALGSGAAAFFPFLREAVANLTLKGRFGAIWMKPLNLLVLQQQATPSEP